MASLFQQPACLVLIDADHFKSINDGFGHAAGDEALRQLTGCLVRTFRRRDDVVARYGGEEFGIILRETVLREAVLLSERLVESVRDLSIDHAGRTIKLTVSSASRRWSRVRHRKRGSGARTGHSTMRRTAAAIALPARAALSLPR